jgi:hypothetical protein
MPALLIHSRFDEYASHIGILALPLSLSRTVGCGCRHSAKSNTSSVPYWLVECVQHRVQELGSLGWDLVLYQNYRRN